MYEISLNVSAGGDCSSVAVTGVSAQSAIFFSAGATVPIVSGCVLVTPTVDIFIRQGVNPTALATGADCILLGGQTYRIPVAAGNRFAVIAVGASGMVYFAPQG